MPNTMRNHMSIFKVKKKIKKLAKEHTTKLTCVLNTGRRK